MVLNLNQITFLENKMKFLLSRALPSPSSFASPCLDPMISHMQFPAKINSMSAEQNVERTAIMAEAWKKLKDNVKAKRTGAIAKVTKKRPKGQELTVQRLSSHVTGKAQKYTRIGPREFVPFEDDKDFSLENIKLACEEHFAPVVGTDVICDVLAGEQGPSCKGIEHIPDQKIVHIRFIQNKASFSQGDDEKNQTKREPPRKRITDERFSRNQAAKYARSFQDDQSVFLEPRRPVNSHPADKPTPSKQEVPLSLSISDMLKLGKLNANQTSSTVIKVFQFDMELLSWCKIPQSVEFHIEREAIGTGGFRKAFKATTKHPNFSSHAWVVKYYLPKALECIIATGQTVDDHNRKVVQMHLLARNFALQLEEELKKQDVRDLYGETLKYKMIFHGETEQDFVSIEEWIPGDFVKYINNTGAVCYTQPDVIGEKAESLSHYSYAKSNRKLMLLDVQGNGYNMFDPEIASSELLDEDNKFLYCTGNLSEVAITNFVNGHKCSIFCRLLDLKPLV